MMRAVPSLAIALLLARPVPALAAGAMVTVDVARTSGPLAADAVGLSYEMRTVGEGGLDAASGNAAAVFATLGVRNIRIGGNTVDYGTFWQPGGKPVPPWASIIITPADVQRVAAFSRSIDAKVAWAVNIQHLDPAAIDDQVGTVLAAFGDHLDSIQCGNEPNGLFGGYPAFKAAFDACKAAIKGRVKISGPDTYGGGGAWNAQFAADEEPVLSQLNYHYYTGARSVAALLAPGAIAAAMKAIDGSLVAAQAHKLSYRTDETNSEAGGGIHGVSDVFGSALWAMHYALATAERGAGLNFHGFLGVCGQPTVNGKNDFYTPICAASTADAKAKVMTAAPEYYGLWMATHLGPGRFHPVSVAGAANLTAFAVKGDDGATRIALIEKSATGNKLPVTIALPGVTGVAQALRLTAASLNATSGVQIQGASLDRDGHLTPGAPDQVAAANGTITLDLATGSAALVTVGVAGEEARPDGGPDAETPDAEAVPDAGPAPTDAMVRADAAAMPSDTAPAVTEEPPGQVRGTGGGCSAGGTPSVPALVLLMMVLAGAIGKTARASRSENATGTSLVA
jgi:Glycosyl hydrolase family 79 C-terminal beta domain